MSCSIEVAAGEKRNAPGAEITRRDIMRGRAVALGDRRQRRDRRARIERRAVAAGERKVAARPPRSSKPGTARNVFVSGSAKRAREARRDNEPAET